MSYYEAGTCALCGRASDYLLDSEWGRVHEDCGYRRASQEQRAEAAAVVAILDDPPPPPPALVAALANAKPVRHEEQRARDEALRQEGRREAAAMLRQRAEELRTRAKRDEAEGFEASWTLGDLTASGELDLAAAAIEQGEHLKETP